MMVSVLLLPNSEILCKNGGEFKNYKMEQLTNKLGLKVEFGPVFLPWSNGIDQRKYYSADVTTKKMINKDSKVMLQDALNMRGQTHNTNVNTQGYKSVRV